MLQLRTSFAPLVDAFGKLMPHSSKLPPFEYGAKGCIDYFMVILKPLMEHQNLRQLFQVLREVGNLLVLIQMAQSAVIEVFGDSGLADASARDTGKMNRYQT
jgi:hypothetical protein